jgi:hypothetical protein
MASTIYKVNEIGNENKITNIHVFLGFNSKQVEFDDLNDHDKFKTQLVDGKDYLINEMLIFDAEEVANIKKNDITVVFLEEEIHQDDNIFSIKLKIVQNISERNFSMEEIYLFCSTERTLNSETIYDNLTQTNNIPLSKDRLASFFANIEEYKDVVEQIEGKGEYDYDDILELNLDDKVVQIDTVIGQKFFIVSGEYPFTINPYNATSVDTYLQKSSNEITTLNSHLLLNVSNKIQKNNLFMCLASNVLEYNKTNDVPQEYLIKIYFPLLYKKDINSIEKLETEKEALIAHTYAQITDSILNNFKNVNMFYDVYKEKTEELRYKQNGVKFIKIVLHPENEIKISLEIIFKLINATEVNPLIKYNFSSRQENIYRIFTNKTTTDGEKIPFLQKSMVFKLMKTIGKSRSVAVYVDYKMENACDFILEFEENGNITMSAEFENIVSIDDNFLKINEVFTQASNTIIESIRLFFEQNGYKISTFQGLQDPNVEIKEIIYESVVTMGTDLKINNFKGCLSSVFNIVSNDDKGFQMRFKRVKNFNKLDSQEIFVIDQNKKGTTREEIVRGLVENYDLSDAEAREFILKIINELKVERGVKKRDIEIKVNPGFETTLSIDRIKGEITISVYSIDHLLYLNTLPIYIDTLLRLSYDKTTTNYPVELIDELCLQDVEVEDLVFKDDIIALSEEDVEHQKTPSINSDENAVEYNEPAMTNLENVEKTKLKSVFDIFNNDEEEEESSESENSSGGAVLNNRLLPEDELLKEDEPSVKDEEGPIIKEDNNISVDEKTDNQEPIIEENVDDIVLTDIEETDVAAEPIVIEDNKEEESDVAAEPIVIEDNKEESDVAAGPKKKAEPKKTNDKDGMSLTHPYIFQKRLEDRATTLFATLKDDKFNSYSRMCPSNVRRQPVILNQQELDDINEKYPNYLDEENGDIIHYTSNPGNKENPENYYYTCPRYWCLLTDSIISDEDVALKKCGEILPRDAKKVIPGHYVYEFSNPSEHIGSNGEYLKHFPGFHKDATKDDKCIPCCFKNWNTPKQIQRRKTCEGPSEDSESAEPAAAPEPVDDQYIKGAEKFPLAPGRWGYLPVSIQKFFHEVGAECKISKTNKTKSSCLLRHGIEKNINKSFIGCIADVLFYAEHGEDNEQFAIPETIAKKSNKNKKDETAKKPSMTEIIIKSITIDSFITFQNATLIENFADEDSKTDQQVEHDFGAVPQQFSDSKLYTKSTENIKNKRFFLKALNAFENFSKYLLDDSELVDYTYLWDIICTPNPRLFKNGINLVVLNIPDNDSTNNVDFICPSNHYSNHVFDTRKRTLFIVGRDNMYEPIYEYKDVETKVIINKTFSEYDRQLPTKLRSVFSKIIKPIIQKNCLPIKSSQNYYFNSPILLDDLIKQLNSRSYIIEHQVMNLRGKVIGVTAKDTKQTRGFLPCYPSSFNTKYEYDYLYITDEDHIWNTYTKTLAFLNRWFKIKKTNKLTELEPILEKCSPKDAFCKVIEDNMIVGFLTNTNQFIQISHPQPNIMNDQLHFVDNNNYLVAENEITSSNKVDQKRIDYTNKIKLEYNFYNAFRNTLRILLNDYVNLKQHEVIKAEINKQQLIYSKKMDSVKQKLKDLALNKVEFADNIDFDSFKEITTCVVYQQDKCNEKNPLCMYKGKNCVLIIPSKNLIAKTDNEDFYFTRLADELIRYNHIKSFIFQKNNYLSFDKIGYNLSKNEIIMLQSLLTQEYFEKLVAGHTNKYVVNNTYDTTNPKFIDFYNAAYTLNDIIQPEEEKIVTTKSHIIKASNWKKCFIPGTVEIEYPSTNYGTFRFVIDIIERTRQIVLTDGQIRMELVTLYKLYIDKYKIQLANILIDQGKKASGEQVKSDTLKLKYFVLSESYYLTNFDIWLLLDKYKIPFIFITPLSHNLPETGYQEKIFVGYSEEDTRQYVFIMCPANNPEVPGEYKVIECDTNIMINLSELRDCTTLIDTAITKTITIEHFLNVFRPELTTQYKLKQKGHRENPADMITFDVQNNDEKEIEMPQISPPKLPSPSIPDLAKIESEDLVEFTPEEKPKKSRKARPKKVVQKQRVRKTKTKKNKNDEDNDEVNEVNRKSSSK